jgi:DNA-binding NarL/FixJ family response regulator
MSVRSSRIRAVVVEDEPHARQSLREYSTGVEWLALVGEAGDGAQAVRFIDKLEPDLVFHDPGNNYMESYCQRSWEGCIENNPKITVTRIPNSRACLWFDQPQEVKRAVVDFLKGVD